MSYSKYTKPENSTRKNDLLLINGLFHFHDLACNCESPASHLTYLLATNCSPKDYTAEEKKKLQKCLGFTTGDDEPTDDLGIDAGDLDKLFEEDVFQEEEG